MIPQFIADVAVLGLLAELRHPHRVPRRARGRGEGPRGRHLERGRGREAGADRHVAVHHQVEAANRESLGGEGPDDARDVREPVVPAGGASASSASSLVSSKAIEWPRSTRSARGRNATTAARPIAIGSTKPSL